MAEAKFSPEVSMSPTGKVKPEMLVSLPGMFKTSCFYRFFLTYSLSLALRSKIPPVADPVGESCDQKLLLQKCIWDRFPTYNTH